LTLASGGAVLKAVPVVSFPTMRELLKAVLKTGSGSGGTLLLGMITMKVMAVVLGPSGLGLYSLLRQTMDFSNKLGTLGGGAALVQGLASRKGQAQDDYLVTTLWVFVLGTLLVVVVLLFFAPWIALWVFDRNDGQTTSLVRWLALPVTLGVAATYISGVLNGFRAIGLLALFQILGAVAVVFLVYPVSRLVETGYSSVFIIMLSAPPAVGVALGTWSAMRAGWLTPLLHDFRNFHVASLRQFFSLAGILLVTDLGAAGTVLTVRSLIVRHDGIASAGIFATAWTLSMTYVMLILSSFITYYLPTLSQTSDPLDRVALLQRVMRLATLLMVPLITAVIALKPLAIEILYSSEFASSLEIIRWMLIGDYFKVAGWVLAMPMLAFADMKVFFWAEVLWSAVFLVSAGLALLVFNSMQGIGVGFLLAYVGYVAYCLHYVRSRHHLRLSRQIVRFWLLGLALVVGVSWHTWSDTHVDWVAAFLWISAAIAVSWLSLTQNERTEILRIALRQREI
jgi:O-antigen/teichoic acid export membrane protein